MYPFEETLQYLCSKEMKVSIVLVDPPYTSIVGGHKLTNSNWENSCSRVLFNWKDRVRIGWTSTTLRT